MSDDAEPIPNPSSLDAILASDWETRGAVPFLVHNSQKEPGEFRRSQNWIGGTRPSAMELLVDLGIVRELTGKRRNRVFAYDRYLTILSEGTEA